MAEFCLKCWNEINKTDDPASKYILSKELDLCEGCGKRTHVIVAQRKIYYRHKLRFVILPFKIVYKILYIGMAHSHFAIYHLSIQKKSKGWQKLKKLPRFVCFSENPLETYIFA